MSDGRCGSIGYGIATAYAKEGIRGLSRVAATEWTPDGMRAYSETFKANVKMPPAGHYGDSDTGRWHGLRT